MENIKYSVSSDFPNQDLQWQSKKDIKLEDLEFIDNKDFRLTIKSDQPFKEIKRIKKGKKCKSRGK